ncbi:MAG TPA: hypothetical protein VKU84_16900, partial [Stellaceae bacterium]|nr:hypothetical protein [Stellaceae bacterium]
GSAGATAICSDTGVVAQIKSADNTAYAAVKKAAASGSSTDTAAATAALTALQTILEAPAVQAIINAAKPT